FLTASNEKRTYGRNPHFCPGSPGAISWTKVWYKSPRGPALFSRSRHFPGSIFVRVGQHRFDSPNAKFSGNPACGAERSVLSAWSKFVLWDKIPWDKTSIATRIRGFSMFGAIVASEF